MRLDVTVAITTFNRGEYLEKMRRSLRETTDLETAHIRVYDDCSTDYDKAYLQTMFPDAKSIMRSKRNVGCDENLLRAMEHFLTTNDDVILIADSDIIFNPEWLVFLRQHFLLTDGIMSLYNSCLHPPLEHLTLNGTPFERKEAIGAAGTVMSRSIVQIIARSLGKAAHIDWKFSDILQTRGARLLVSQRSYVQHIGIHGKNNLGVRTDFGLNFLPGIKTNEEIMIAYTEELLTMISQAPESLVPKSDLNYRVGKMVLDPIRFLRHPRRFRRIKKEEK
jgi:glycosyltransferase involved in cell wall biosynthesis